MPHPRKTLFISDLHLEENRPDITHSFLSLLKTCEASSIDAIYILGDLFEAWIGDDDHTLFHREIISALKAVTQKNIPLYFLHGNRDFLIGKQFSRETGCQLMTEEQKIMLYGTPVLLMHGDTLCTRDIAYLKWRKKSHNPFLNRLLFLYWPLSLRRRFANKMREKSAQYTQQATQEIMDVSQEAVEQVMQKHAVQFLIHGHTHRPAIHTFPLAHSAATRIVLGAWHHQGNMLSWNEWGQRELVSF